MIRVTITDKDGMTTTSTFDKVEIMIGRVKDEYNDIVLRQEIIQRHHARIVLKDNHLILIHLNCRDTFVNGHKITKPQVLNEGDKVVIGDFTLEFEMCGVHDTANIATAEQANPNTFAVELKPPPLST